MKKEAKKYKEFIETSNLKSLPQMIKVFAALSEDLSPKLRQRFCKDWNIPVKLYTEPYFSERLAIYNQHVFIVHLLGEFVELVTRAGGEQGYFTLYNEVKDKAIQYLNDSESMTYFREQEDMNKYPPLKNFPSKDIFKQTFIGKTFVSIDLSKGNYTALRHYDPEIVGNTDTYEDFMAMFTDEPYLKGSKYIRQVIFGNVNPKRQVTYEKYLMSQLLSDLLGQGIPTESVVFLSTDEIVLDADAYTDEIFSIIDATVSNHRDSGVNTRVEHFKLHYIPEAETYVKEFLNEDLKGTVEFKCMTSNMMPFVLKTFYGNPITDNDYVFELDGRLAKWLDETTISQEHRLEVVMSWDRIPE